MDQVRGCLLGVLRNYVTVEDDGEAEEEEEEDLIHSRGDGDAPACTSSPGNDRVPRRRAPPLGPLNVQGIIDHRLSIADVLARSDQGCHRSAWDDISNSLRRIQDVHAMGGGVGGDGAAARGGGGEYFHGNRQYGAHNVYSSVPPEVHAAVALNAMMEKHTSQFHNSFF